MVTETVTPEQFKEALEVIGAHSKISLDPETSIKLIICLIQSSSVIANLCHELLMRSNNQVELSRLEVARETIVDLDKNINEFAVLLSHSAAKGE